MVADPMITIKKADGTFAKVTLSEFKKMQAGQKTQETTKNVGQPTPTPPKRGIDEHPKPAHHPALHHAAKHHAVPHHAAAHASTAHHVKKSTINNIQYPISNKPPHVKLMSRADAGSLLEEKMPVKSLGVLFSPKREKQVEMVVGKLGFNVAPDLLGRLKSLILARLKDIKSEDEARELLSRSVKNGGLGLTESQVEKVLQSCREADEMDHTEVSTVPALKGNHPEMLPMVEPSELLPSVIPTTKEESLSGSYSPLGRGRGGLEVNQKSAYGQPTPGLGAFPAQAGNTGDYISKMLKESAAAEPIFKLDTRPVMKKSMQDVSASAIEMGPTEEIKSTTLTDFRRLSGNPEEAARRLQQKMFNLQDESFVLYLDALDAYRASPLYGEYMRAICQSLAERKSLASVLTIQNGIKLNEVMAIIEMERTL